MYLNLSTPKSQTGVILVLALVILLILTMLVVSSMNTTNMQVLMTGNTQYHTKALNDAETALRFAETSIEQFATSVSAQPKTGYYDLKKSTAQEIDFSNFTWNSDTAATHNIGSRGSMYVIEYTGFTTQRGGDAGWSQIKNHPAGNKYYLYRITARSTSARGAIRLVQSVYATETAPAN
ncbi:MAG: PilX N-terminal domain-containing pilus assembly protein [Thiohalomonadales bacterium]